jgi:hypothetical protein
MRRDYLTKGPAAEALRKQLHQAPIIQNSNATVNPQRFFVTNSEQKTIIHASRSLAVSSFDREQVPWVRPSPAIWVIGDDVLALAFSWRLTLKFRLPAIQAQNNVR